MRLDSTREFMFYTARRCISGFFPQCCPLWVVFRKVAVMTEKPTEWQSVDEGMVIGAFTGWCFLLVIAFMLAIKGEAFLSIVAGVGAATVAVFYNKTNKKPKLKG